MTATSRPRVNKLVIDGRPATANASLESNSNNDRNIHAEGTVKVKTELLRSGASQSLAQLGGPTIPTSFSRVSPSRGSPDTRNHESCVDEFPNTRRQKQSPVSPNRSALQHCGAGRISDCERCSFCLTSKLTSVRRLNLNRFGKILCHLQPKIGSKEVLGLVCRYARSDDFAAEFNLRVGWTPHEINLCARHKAARDESDGRLAEEERGLVEKRRKQITAHELTDTNEHSNNLTFTCASGTEDSSFPGMRIREVVAQSDEYEDELAELKKAHVLLQHAARAALECQDIGTARTVLAEALQLDLTSTNSRPKIDTPQQSAGFSKAFAIQARQERRCSQNDAEVVTIAEGTGRSRQGTDNLADREY